MKPFCAKGKKQDIQTRGKKKKITNAHPHGLGHVLNENVNRDDYLRERAEATQAISVASTLNMFNSIKA